MAATVSGSKTVTKSPVPHLQASALTTLLATAIENLTVLQFHQIEDALARIPSGKDPSKTLGQLLV
jgi:hypothetical protein